MHVRPKQGYKLREPDTFALVPDEGIEVRDTDLYWIRRLRDGDAVRDPPPPPAQHSAHHAQHRKGE